MAFYNPNDPIQRELASDMWIEQNVPGGLDSRLGRELDAMMGGNPNPTFGQILPARPAYGYSYGYNYGPPGFW